MQDFYLACFSLFLFFFFFLFLFFLFTSLLVTNVHVYNEIYERSDPIRYDFVKKKNLDRWVIVGVIGYLDRDLYKPYTSHLKSVRFTIENRCGGMGRRGEQGWIGVGRGGQGWEQGVGSREQGVNRAAGIVPPRKIKRQCGLERTGSFHATGQLLCQAPWYTHVHMYVRTYVCIVLYRNVPYVDTSMTGNGMA